MDRQLVTEIFVPKTNQRGSGYVVGPRLILTAYHVVSEEESSTVEPVTCLVRPQGDWEGAQSGRGSQDGYSSARLIWPKLGRRTPRINAKRRVGELADVALLRVSGSGSDLIREAPTARFNVGQISDHFDCRLAGYPLLSALRLPDRQWFRDLSEDEREEALAAGDYAPDMTDLVGQIVPGNLQRASYYLISGTTDQPLDRELWKGLSGAAVFDGDDCIVGVVTNNVAVAANDCVVAERISNPAVSSAFCRLVGIDVSRDSLKRETRLFIECNRSIASAVAERSRRATNDSLLTPTLGSSVALELIKIFVKPEFRERPALENATEPSSQPRASVSIHDVVQRHPAVLVIGDPGSGKSMAAADLALGLSAAWSRGERDQYFPLLLMAKDLEHNPTCLKPGPLLSSAFAKAIESGYPTLPDTFLNDAGRAGVPVLLIVDGLDEIIGDINVGDFLRWMGGVSAFFGQDVRLVLFSRPLGLDHIDPALEPFALYSLLPFNEERSAILVEKIFLCAGRDSKDAQRWHYKVRSMPLASLLDNPALITMLAIAVLGGARDVHAETRSDVIGLFVKTLLASFDDRIWPDFAGFVKETLYEDRAAFGATFHNSKARMELLANIGFAATEARELDETFFRRVFQEFRQLKDAGVYSIADEADYEEIIRQFLLRSGLLTGRSGRLRFCHNLIREYLASVKLEWAVADAADNWLLRWRSPLWREAILMALPGWLRLAESPEHIFQRLIMIGKSSYDGGLFCGAALLERLPISAESEDLLFQLTLRALEQWNTCESLLAGPETANANPSALIKRLIAQSNLRAAMVRYFNYNMQCPLSPSELIRLLSDLSDPSIIEPLCENGTSASEAIAALFEMGSGELAERHARSLLASSRIRPDVADRLLSHLAATSKYDFLKEVSETVTIATPFRLAAAAKWFTSIGGRDAEAAIRECFYGTALGGEQADYVIDALAASGVAWRKSNLREVAPKTLEKVLTSCINRMINLMEPESQGLDDRPGGQLAVNAKGAGEPALKRQRTIEASVASALELLRQLRSNSAAGLSVVASIESKRGGDGGGRAQRPVVDDEGVHTVVEEVDEQDLESDRVSVERGLNRSENAPVESSSFESATDLREIMFQKANAYQQTGDHKHLQELFDIEANAAKEDDRRLAATIIRRALLLANQVDLLRERLVSTALSMETRADVLTALAKLGDFHSLATAAEAFKIDAALREGLIESFNVIGLSEALPSLRRAAVLDPSLPDLQRVNHFTTLLAEDSDGSREVAKLLLATAGTPRSLRLAAASFLASLAAAVFTPLVEIAKEAPSDWAAIVEKLCEHRPVNRATALAILVATSDAPPDHFHAVSALFTDGQSKHDIRLLLELAERIVFRCDGSTEVFERLFDLLGTSSASLNEAQRDRVCLAGLAALTSDNSVSAPFAALALARIKGTEDWIETISRACLASPTLLSQLLEKLSLSDEYLTQICGIVANATQLEPRMSAALGLLKVSKFETAVPMLEHMLSNPTEASTVLFKSEFLTAVEDNQLDKQVGTAIARAFRSQAFAEPISLHGFYRCGIIALRRLRSKGKREVESHLDDVSGSIGARLRLVWKLAIARSRRDIKGCISVGKELVLCMPEEKWLREILLTASREAGDPYTIQRWLADEMSFFQSSDPDRSERCRGELEALH